MSQGKIRIHCFEPNGVEGCPSNTYETEDLDSALGCIKDLLCNKDSGISRILIENPMFSDSDCYGDIVAMSPMNIDRGGHAKND